MRFCFNCGEQVKNDSKFCFNCGTKLIDNIKKSDSLSPKSDIETKAIVNSQPFSLSGIILTNISVLAGILNCGMDEIRNIIQTYILQLKPDGYNYTLLDSNDNKIANLTSLNSWQEHVDLVKEYIKGVKIKPEYLFIIGGHEVIPMPRIDNEPACYSDDATIDTDLPYAYLKTSDFDSLLWAGEIFNEQLFFNVGRLPTGKDNSVDDITLYFQRSSNILINSITINSCFGISAGSWEYASNEVIDVIDSKTELHYSPDHNLQTIADVFNDQAESFYFNLHGSDMPTTAQYFGDEQPAISPDFLSSAQKLNSIVTEACYGAKFIGYLKSYSMLLSSIYANTVTFVGSSRVAFGNPTDGGGIFSADVIANEFIKGINEGLTSGMSFSLARISVFESTSDDFFNYDVTTCAEFNLYGDPMISFNKVKSKSTGTKRAKTISDISKGSFQKKPPVFEKVTFANSDKGVLNNIREIVNEDIRKIRETVNEHVYKYFNVEPRDLTHMFLVKTNEGKEFYNYVYLKRKPYFKQLYSVFAEKTGAIKSIISSK
jgi:hypothetical protein